eukprot:1154981-Pelagomonas_calceolata.AAC.3
MDSDLSLSHHNLPLTSVESALSMSHHNLPLSFMDSDLSLSYHNLSQSACPVCHSASQYVQSATLCLTIVESVT